MNLIMIVLFCSLTVFSSCSSSKKVTGTKELQKRSNKGQLLEAKIKKISIKDEYSAPKRVEGSYFTAWIHGHRLPDGSYFHGGEITIIDESPSFDFE